MHKTIMKACLFTPLRSGGRWGLPGLFWGDPGAAKTDVIEQTCAQYGLPCETLSPSERGEGAFGVIPVPLAPLDVMTKRREAYADKLEAEGADLDEAWRRALKKYPLPRAVLEYPAPAWTQKFDEHGHGVIYVDEVTSTTATLQAPVMGLVLRRVVGGWTAPPRVRVIAAANPPHLAAGGYELRAPLANRFGHFQWDPPTVDEHIQYMMRGSSDKSALREYLRDNRKEDEAPDDENEVEDTYDVAQEEARVLKLWPTAWSRAVGLETSFLRANSTLKNHDFNTAPVTSLGRAWPSDRSWENATRAFASSEVHGLTETEREVFVSGFIGEGAAKEFFAFMAAQDIPDPAKLLDGDLTFSHDVRRLDRTFAVFQTCSTFLMSPEVQRRQSFAARKERFWEMLLKFGKAGDDLDLAVPTVNALMDRKIMGDGKSKVTTKTLAIFYDLLRAAGSLS